MIKVICPYCGTEMNYVTRGIRGSTQIAYFQCQECKAKSPQVNAPFQLSILSDLKEQAAKAAELRTNAISCSRGDEDM